MAAVMTADTLLNATSVVDRNLEQGRGSKVAFREGDRLLTYLDLYREMNRAAGLLRDLGVCRGDRLLLVLDDTVAFPVAFLAAMRIGAVPMPVSPLDKADNFRHFVDDSYASVVFADAPLVPMLQAHLKGRDLRFVSVDGPAEAAIDFGSAISSFADELDPVETHRDDVAFWLFSSGSTGAPKGVVHMHRNIAVTCERFAGQVLDMSEEDVVFSTTKLHHAYGLGNSLFFPLFHGASTVLMAGPPKAERIVEVVRKFRPSMYFSVPALYAAVLRERVEETAMRSVRICVSAAEALPASTLDQWRARFGLEIIDGVGSTEMLHIYCSNRPGRVVSGTTGRPVPGYELRLIDDDGTVVDGPGSGMLEVCGGSRAAYYWHQDEKTKNCMRGKWFFTGDRYRRDEAGCFVYEGRADDMFKVGGLWVSPAEMETTLVAHERVLDAGVIGIRENDLSRVAAFVICADDEPGDEQLAEDLRLWCKQRLRRYEYPHLVYFVDDLPRTVNGKVQRFRLRQLAAEQPPSQAA